MSFDYNITLTEKDFADFLQKNTESLNKKYDRRKLPENLNMNSYHKNLLGEVGEAFNPLTESLYSQSLLALKNKCYILVFNSIYILFELIIIELIILAEARKFLLTESNNSDDPANTPLFEFAEKKRDELENKKPEELLRILHEYKIINDQEYIDLKIIKKFIRLTTSHSKIKKFIRNLIAIGIIPKKLNLIHGKEIDSLEKLMKEGVVAKDVEKVFVSSEHEMLFQIQYLEGIKDISYLLLVYYYDFIARKGEFYKL